MNSGVLADTFDVQRSVQRLVASKAIKLENNLDLSVFKKINYIEGDLFPIIKEKSLNAQIIVPHVCNNQNFFGKGFAAALSKHYPKVKQTYHSDYVNGSAQLGVSRFIECDNNILICNMIAQTFGGKRPLFYNYLAKCMDEVANRIQEFAVIQGVNYEIHAPVFGSGLAGGDFKFIRLLIEDCWIRRDIYPINIYYLPGTFLSPE